MSVTVQDPHDTPAFESTPEWSQDVTTVQKDLYSGNFTGAWDTALSTAGDFTSQPTVNAMSNDPLIQAMEGNLNGLAPGLQWNASTDKSFIDGFEQATGASSGNFNANPLGKNEYGLWGQAAANQGKADAQAAEWAQNYPGQPPNVQQALGAKPTKNFAQKYGATIANVVVGIVAPELLPVVDAGIAMINHQNVGKAVLGGVASAIGGPIIGGAVTGGLNGGFKGALIGAATGAIGAGVGSAIGGALGSDGLGLNQSIAGAIGKVGGNYAAGQVGKDLRGMMYNNGGGNQQLGSNIYGPNGQITGQTQSVGDFGNASGGGPNAFFGDVGNLLQSAGQLFGPVAGAMGAQQGQKYFEQAGSGAMLGIQSGQNYGFNGMGGMGGTWNNGQLNLNPGAFGGAASGFSQFANSQSNMANMYGSGYVPSNVTQGFNQFNSQINQGINNANSGANSAMGVMGLGQSTLNSAAANQQNAYNTSLNSALAALNPQIQQQSNALLNSNFEKGMAGTSGGALQTQALQNSFNTANLQAQNQAVGQGLNAYNSTINAGMGMFNSGAGQLGNFNNQGVNFGQAGMQGAMNYNMFSPQMAGMYQNNANAGIQGASGINNMMLGNFQAGQGAAGLQGNLAIGGAGAYNNTGHYFNQGGNGLMGNLGNQLGTPGAVNGLVSGAGNLFKNLAGLGGSAFSNMFGGNNGSGGNVTGFTLPSDNLNANLNNSNFDYGTGGGVPGTNPDGSSVFDTGGTGP